MRIIVGIAGASGVIYGIRLLEYLKAMPDVQTHLVLTKTARMNIPLETDWTVKRVEALADHVYNNNDLGASIASGSFRTDGMIVAACAMKTLSAIANSYGNDLIVRAADVILKERRKLVLMPRETPLHAGHCELLGKACALGAIVAPPMPAMYIRPQSIDDLVDHSVGRILDLFGMNAPDMQRWDGVASARKRVDNA
ncbi:MAG: 3-octaprenyl-4-hydroxybenzoate carboxy-lyase [Robiginitomaculum sp.]|nr:MAG: 3-octaprenyl-4-hydroxybenzoate carboxy-lyase [Robiginitomaculum sp.]